MKEDSAGDKALKQFADLMIQKIKEVERDWKKQLGFSPEGGGGLPQNIEGRVYNGINLFMLYLLFFGRKGLQHTIVYDIHAS